MAYTFDEPRIGLLQIANIDTGIIPPGNGTTAIPTPPNVLGSVLRAFDPTLGEGEFTMLKGVANTIVGSVVIYDATTYVTTLAPSTANLARPVAISMAANTAATTFSWYQICGSATVAKQVNHQIAPNLAIGISSSAGKIVASSSAGAGKEVEAARYTAATTAASASTTCVIIIDRPMMQGRIT